jgi:hypothetical protein
MVVQVAVEKDGKGDAALTVRKAGQGGVDALLFEFFPTVLDAKTYLNLREKRSTQKDKNLAPDFGLVRYEVKADTLTVWYLLSTGAEAAGLHKAADDSRLFTDDSAALAAFVQKSPATAWAPIATLKRMSLAATTLPAKK